MNGNVKHITKAPALLNPGQLYHCGGGNQGSQLHHGSFFSGGFYCLHLRSTNVLATTQGRTEGTGTNFHSGGYPVCRIALGSIDSSFAE